MNLKCPRDQSVLSSHQKGRLKIHHCTKCGGFQVCLNQFSAKALSEKLLKKIQQSNPTENALQSPYTDEKMIHFTHRGVELDYCKESNSVWFDRGEYTKIFAAETTGEKSKPSMMSKAADGVEAGIDGVSFLPGIDSIIDVSSSALSGLGDFLGDFIGGIDI